MKLPMPVSLTWAGASEIGMRRPYNTIMQTCIIAISAVLQSYHAIEQIKKSNPKT